MYEGFYDAPNPAGRLKHAILRRYLPAWLAILGRGARGGGIPPLHYVDTHAGRGRYEDGSLGSPLLAIEAASAVQLDPKMPQFEFSAHFIELEADHIAVLNEELPRLLSNTPRIHATVYQGDSSAQLPHVLDSIPSSAATFVFIDPFGYKDQVAASRVLSVLRGRPRTEIFLTLMSGFVARFTTDQVKEATFDELLGTTKWRDVREGQDKERRIVEIYSHVLMADEANITGNSAALLAFPIELKPAGWKSPYYLVHVSQNPKARFEMERAVQSVEGFKARPLFAKKGVVGALEEVVNSLPPKGQRVRVLEAILGPLWRHHPLMRWDPDIQLGLKLLHEDGVIKLWTKGDNARRPGTLPQATDTVTYTGQPRRTEGFDF